ncbi:hypothetical protein [Deinococcus sp. NW-56]|uniref:hypothetical protein n=1 Tax=Deinococcus sp. NW-56 TaxID=2080419 RepID=UPI001F30B831|nr:hypothetical protein [Deinococcus sp. NW-56]
MTRLLSLGALLALSLGAAQTATPPVPEDVRGTLFAPRTAEGPLRVSLTLRSSLASPVELDAGRDSRQNCVFGPLVRVLRVGTREVVSPAPGSEPRLCAQDLRIWRLAAGGGVTLTRNLDLPPGEYMVEGWFAGRLGGKRVRVPAQPVRVTVRGE